MSFYRKYELERLVQKVEPKTFRAREVAGGRTVFLHLLAGMEAAPRADLIQRVRALLAAGKAEFIEVDDNEFAPFVVTTVVDGFTGLPALVDRLAHGVTASPPPPVSAAPKQAAPPPPPLPPPAPPAQPPGEFTAMFTPAETLRPRETPVSQMPPPALPPSPKPAPVAVQPAASVMPPAAAPPPANEPGEFTRMFSGASGKAAPPPSPAPAARPPAPQQMAPPPAPPPPPPPAASSGTSEFSKLFGKGPAPTEPMPPSEQGEFSRLFGAPPGTPSDNPAGFAPAPPPPPPRPQAQLPWEPPHQAAPPAAPPPPPPAYAAPQRPVVETPDTQKMQAWTPPQAPHPAPPPPAADQGAGMWNSPPPAEKSGPGEFTRFFASPMASSQLPIEEIERGKMAEAMAPADKPFEGPGEFTRWFGKSSPGDRDAAPPQQAPAQYTTFSGRATGLFQMPNLPPPPGTGEHKGPSEYTRIMEAQQVQGEGAPPPAYVPGAQPGKGPLIAVIVIIAVVLIALVVTLILTMRH